MMVSKAAFDTSENQRKEGEQANGSQYKTKERVTRTRVHKPKEPFLATVRGTCIAFHIIACLPA